MAGERTPDTSNGGSTSGTSSDNDISLREHIQRQIETEHRFFERTIEDLRRHHDERYLNAMDVVEARAIAESARWEASLAAIDSHIQAQLQAAENAVAKAENANDKRFDSVNEFRAQLGDQAATFMPRSESIQRHDTAADRASRLEAHLIEQIGLINSRLDLAAGNGQGIDKAWAYLIGAVGLAGGVVAVAIAVLGI